MSVRRCFAIPLLATLLLALHAACAAPIVQDAGAVGPAVLETLPGASPVELQTDDGVTLRGAFLEAKEGAPVILHLLPSAASTETGVPGGIGRIALDGTLQRLRDLGWSSLAVDYRGLGRSDGRRNADRLGADGDAMWREAVRRAGGSPDRVVVRATSLGSLVAAHLLAQDTAGGKPAGVVLIAPIRASTVVRNAARDRRGSFAAWWAARLYGSPAIPDLDTVVASTPVPVLVVLPSEDPYLTPEEAAQLADAARAGGHRVEILAGDHPRAVLRAWGFEIDEDGFGGRRVSTLMEAERRFLDDLQLAVEP
ncbi:MAG: alpha/beta fold hydrolase [Planctomycetota bacterium]